MAGFFCLWMLYYKNYNDFQQIIEAFNRLSSDVQFTLADDFIDIYEKIRFSLHPFLTPKKLSQFKPEEMAKIRRILNIDQFALPHLTKYISFEEILKLSSEYQEVILSHYFFVGNLFKNNITLLEIYQIKKEVFLLIQKSIT